MDLDATPYRIFVTVADQLSFTRASELAQRFATCLVGADP